MKTNDKLYRMMLDVCRHGGNRDLAKVVLAVVKDWSKECECGEDLVAEDFIRSLKDAESEGTRLAQDRIRLQAIAPSAKAIERLVKEQEAGK